jgi:hypothetical protein
MKERAAAATKACAVCCDLNGVLSGSRIGCWVCRCFRGSNGRNLQNSYDAQTLATGLRSERHQLDHFMRVLIPCVWFGRDSATHSVTGMKRGARNR